MQNAAQALVVVRDQFALKNLSDDALRMILPAYREAFERLQFLLKNLPPEGASIERELWLRTQLQTIRAQFGPVADRIYQVLPEAQARAFEEGLSNAQKYLEAGGIKPEVQQTTLSGVTSRGTDVSATGNLPGVNVTSAVEKGFISPSITRQQVVAAARETGFSVLSPGGSKVGLADLLPNWMEAQSKQVERHLRAGFLLGSTNEEITREIGPLGPGRKGWAMTEAVVRTSMAEASQSAHDAFYEANEDLLIPTKSGYKWWWDASNDTRLCQICAPLDGVKFKERNSPPHAWPAHFSCRCKILPWTATQELLEEEEGPRNGSFLEATPVQYDKRGKRLPPPAGYTGDNAYKRPMKVDGQMQWVRRRDLGPGQTTAGDMLQNANEHSKRLVLGKHTEAFNKLTGPGGQYEKDPQGAVRKLLGDPLPPGATAPRPVRGPKPKPPAPKPKAKAAPKPAAPAAPRLDQFKQQFLESPELRDVFEPQGGSGAFMEKLFDRLEGPDEAGANVRKMREFMQKNDIVNHFVKYGEDISKTAASYSDEAIAKVIRSQKAAVKSAVKRGLDPQVIQIAQAEIKQLEGGKRDGLEFLMGYLNQPGAAGYTRSSQGVVVTHMQGNERVGKRFQLLQRLKDSLDQAAAYTRGDNASLPYSTIGDTKEQGWLATMVHEVGHQVHYRGLNSGSYLGSEHFKKGGLASVSRYGLTNEKERFAEAFVQYTLNPEGLRQHAPGLYSWVDEAIKAALQ